MQILPTDLPEVVVVQPQVFRDDRGFFLEVFHEGKFREAGLPTSFAQDNHSHSVRGTLRGLHAQVENPQGKLVRAARGEIFDVAVDIRPGSPTLGRWVGAVLSSENMSQLWVPPGFAHGFCVLSETADVLYKCTALYEKADEIAIAWDDPEIGVAWPVESPLLSPRDREAPRLAEILHRLTGHGKKNS